MADLQRIGLSLHIDCQEVYSPTSSHKAELRLRPTPCVPLTSTHLQQFHHPFLSHPTLAYGALHCRKERADESSTSSAYDCLSLLVLTKRFTNVGFFESEVLLMLKLPASPKPIPQLKCLEGIEEGQRKLTVSKCMCKL